jgi:hypothetical protein
VNKKMSKDQNSLYEEFISELLVFLGQLLCNEYKIRDEDAKKLPEYERYRKFITDYLKTNKATTRFGNSKPILKFNVEWFQKLIEVAYKNNKELKYSSVKEKSLSDYENNESLKQIKKFTIVYDEQRAKNNKAVSNYRSSPKIDDIIQLFVRIKVCEDKILKNEPGLVVCCDKINNKCEHFCSSCLVIF